MRTPWRPPPKSSQEELLARISSLEARARELEVECDRLRVASTRTAQPDQAEVAGQEPGAEAERRTAELAAVIENMPDAVYIGSIEGITLANQPALDQLGFANREELNRHIGTLAEEIQTRDAATGAFIPLERQAFARALGGEPVVQDVIVRHRGTGEDRVVRCAAAPIVLEGQVVAAVAINSDAVPIWGQLDVGRINFGVLQLWNVRAYDPEGAQYSVTGETYEYGGGLGLYLERWVRSLYAEASSRRRSFASLDWSFPGGISTLPTGWPRALNLSGVQLSLGWQVPVSERRGAPE